MRTSDYTVWGGSGMTLEAWNDIRKNYQEGSVILEFGSGEISTPRLAEFYNTTSIEHNQAWVNNVKEFDTNPNVILAPLVNMWYDVGIVKANTPKHIDLIIVDGPPITGDGNRLAFLDHYKAGMFDTTADIIVDDVWREDEMNFAKELAEFTGKTMTLSEPLQYATLS